MMSRWIDAAMTVRAERSRSRPAIRVRRRRNTRAISASGRDASMPVAAFQPRGCGKTSNGWSSETASRTYPRTSSRSGTAPRTNSTSSCSLRPAARSGRYRRASASRTAASRSHRRVDLQRAQRSQERRQSDLDLSQPVYGQPIVGITAGSWKVRLTGKVVRNGAYNAWIERDDPGRVGEPVRRNGACRPSSARSTFVDNSTLSSLACGPRVIGVANLDEARELLNVSSSQGPTRDGA